MKLRVYGTANSVQSNPETTDVEIIHDIELHSHRAGDDLIEIEGIKKDDPIELYGEHDYIEITTLNKLIEKKLPVNPTRGEVEAYEEDIVLNDLLEIGLNERGGGLRKLFKRIKIFGVRKQVAKLTLTQLATRLDKKLAPKEGLFRCSNPNDEITTDKWVSRIKQTKAPILLLIHGTAANVHGTFGGFTTEGDRTIWNSLQEQYGQNVYGVEHRTLTKSPLENAIMVLKALPKNALVHIVSGSRGGLVGEILSQSNTLSNTGFTDDEFKVFENLNRTEDVENMKIINKLIHEKNIKVERFVRVACPAAGTLLASKRLDIYLNIILNLIGLVPFLKTSVIYDQLKEFLLALVKLKSDTDIVPGLEAMDPASPLIKVLNNRSKTINSELVVISGDTVAKGGLMRIVKVRLIDLYFREDNDFIVHSRAMYQGIKRNSMKLFFHRNERVSHFKYFSNPPTQRAILRGLNGEASSEFGFSTLEVKEETLGVNDLIVNRARRRNLPTLVLVPGIMGSKLMANGKRAWAHYFNLARGAMSDLDIDNPNVQPYDLMGSAYKKFVRKMSKSYNIVPFPYDWRKSVEKAGDELALEIKSLLEDTTKPIHIVAHSLGGLVTHSFYNNYKNSNGTGIWDELMKRENSRVLLLGSPLRGSHIIPQIMLREEKFFRILHNLDLKNSQKELLEIVMDYPGILDLLPENTDKYANGTTINYYTSTLYKILSDHDAKFSGPALAKLKKALKTRNKFKTDPIQGKNVYYIAGKSDSTPTKFIENTRGNGKKFKLIGTANGDGRVTWASGITKELKSKTWYMPVGHGEMCNKPEYFRAIHEILKSGKTDQLSKQPLVTRGVQEFFEIIEKEPVFAANPIEFEETIFDITPETDEDQKLPPVKISLTHGDLGFSKYPVAVGHLKGDGLVSAERVVDKYMDGMLSDYHNAGTYPGNIQTSLVVLNNDDGYFKGAIVVGLGRPGVLSKGNLEKSFADSLINLVMKQVEQHKNTCLENELKYIGVSTLLIGSGYAGLTLDDSIKSLLNGVKLANKEIQQLKNSSVKQISEIEFIEIYEDRTISAAQILNNLIKSERYNGFSLSYPIINEVSGKRQKIAELDKNNWWFRIQITEEETDNEDINPLKFVSITDKARSEVRISATQRKLIEKLLKSIVTNPRDGKRISKALFFLIIPPELRDFASDKRDIILMLDKHTATYPWELIYNPSILNRKPIATQSGMIRQLAVSNVESVKYTLEPTAYVIGNPKVPNEFSDLPGALAEAKLAEAKLKDYGFDVTTSYNEHGEEAIIKLFEEDFKVLHIAGHGEINASKPEKSGVILSNDMILSSLEISRMPKTPEFVFINCCFSGAISDQDSVSNQVNELASNIGVAFIEKGVKAVVVAGWAVDDRAAENFAKVLYSEMLSGAQFGEATRKARENTFDRFGDTNTWGAYHCYGSPFYVLKTSKRTKKSKQKEYVYYKEAIVDILNIKSSSDINSSREVEYLVGKLNAIVNSIPNEWLKIAEVSQSLGNTYYELAEYTKAIKFLRLYERCDKEDFSVIGLKNLSSLLMRSALTKKIGGSSKQELKLLIEESERIADVLSAINKTKYILALKGGNYKRKALVLDSEKERVEALKISRDCYKQSYLLDRTLKNNDFYSLINWLTVEELLEYLGEKKSDEVVKQTSINKLIKDAQKELHEITVSEPEFWNLVTEAAFIGYKLFEYSVHKGKTDKMIEEMSIIYRKAWKLRGSIRKAENIIHHFEYLCEILQTIQPSKNEVINIKLENNIDSFEKVLTMVNEIFRGGN